MKRKIGEHPFERADGWCKSAGVLHFRLGVVGDESNGKTVMLNESYFGKIQIGWHRGKTRPLMRAVFFYNDCGRKPDTCGSGFLPHKVSKNLPI